MRTLHREAYYWASLTPSPPPPQDRVGTPLERGHVALIDPHARIALLQFHEGVVKVIPCEGGWDERAVNARLDTPGEVLDLAFLTRSSGGAALPPLLAVLNKESTGVYMRTYDVVVAGGTATLVEAALTADSLPSGSVFLIPVAAPMSGVLVVGPKGVSYVPPRGGPRETVAFGDGDASFAPVCWAPIDATRILIGDADGVLFLLSLTAEDGRVQSFEITRLGACSAPSALAYVDAGFVFVGSGKGDSQLLRLRPTVDILDTASPHLESIARFSNLGPIVDFAAVDLDRAGQCALVTASGIGRNGSLRYVRIGMGVRQ